MNNNMHDKLKELRRGYLYKLRETFSQFKSLNEENPLNIQEIYMKTHTISGTSGLYGLLDLSEISTDLSCSTGFFEKTSHFPKQNF